MKRDHPWVVSFFAPGGNQGSGGRTPLSLITRVSPARRTGVSLGDEHVSAPADQDDQTGACGQGGQGAVQPGVSCLQGALVKADPLDGPAGPAAEDQGIPRLQNGAAVGDPLLAPAEEEDQQTVRGQGEGAQSLPRPGVIRWQGTLEKLDGYLIGVVGEGFSRRWPPGRSCSAFWPPRG